MAPHRIVAASAILLAAVAHHGVANGQASYPMLMSLEPTAAQIGSDSEHTLHSRYTMWGASEVVVSGEGVRGEILHPELEKGKSPPNLQALKIRFHVAPEAEPGVRDFRIITPRGASTLGQLVLVRDPVVVEDAKATEAQEVALPATVCGAISKAEDVDAYRFTAQAGQRLVFHTQSMRLQDRIHDLQQHIDPILTLRNEAGVTIASADNEFYGDPFLAATIPDDGVYTLEVRDVRYQGNRYWQYSIEIHDRPFVRQPHPLGVQRGADTELTLVGFHFDPSRVVDWRCAPDAACGPRQTTASIDGHPTAFPIVLLDRPVTLETDEENNTPEQAQELDVRPGEKARFAVSGRVEREADIDCYAFEAMKGQSLNFEIMARRAGSSLDSHLRVLDASGKSLSTNDDLRYGVRTYSDSQIMSWRAPADGQYVLEIRDLHLRGGPEFTYVLTAEPAEPGFDLFLDSDKTQLWPGGGGVIFVRAVRHHGLDGAISLSVLGLPEGVDATCGRIQAGKNTDACIVLTAGPDAPAGWSNIEIRGEAEIGEGDALRKLTATAVPYQETYQPGGGRGQFPVGMHTVAVHDPQDILAVTLDRESLVLKPGDKAEVKVTLQRSKGFDKNVSLDVANKHLNRVYGSALPEGVTLVASESKILLTGGASEGRLVFEAGKTAKPCDGHVVPVLANVAINFVMKATYASKPLRITVPDDGQ